MDEIIRSIGRVPHQRSTAYGEPAAEQVRRSYDAPEMEPLVLTPVKKYARTERGTATVAAP